MYVFAYGSLLSARSAVRTLPELPAEQCVPARVAGHVRTFDVAFPNDAAQPDKRYLRDDGSRPERVLFANLRPRAGVPPVNGVLLPVEADDVDRLRNRERRYDFVEVTARVRPYQHWTMRQVRVFTFVGSPGFTHPESAARGVVASSYFGTIMQGVRDWDGRCPGFGADFAASTQHPAAERVVPLRRVDLPG
jgi:hypothetical protein